MGCFGSQTSFLSGQKKVRPQVRLEKPFSFNIYTHRFDANRTKHALPYLQSRE